jgi:general stress protein 26
MIVTQEEAIQAGLELVNHSQTAMLSTIGDEGYPHIRAMLKKETEGLKTFWFSTNTSSSKVPQIQQKPRGLRLFRGWGAVHGADAGR